MNPDATATSAVFASNGETACVVTGVAVDWRILALFDFVLVWHGNDWSVEGFW
jgi:hypothetical protein